MRQILLSGFFLLALTGFVQAQRIPLEVSFGVGGYFPEDGRYSRYFDHNPANFSGQVTYGWSVLDIKAGFERMQRWNRGGDKFLQTSVYVTGFTYDSSKITHTTSTLNSYVRASGFRFGAAFHPFRAGAFSPFIGFGTTLISSKGYGDSALVVYDSVFLTSGGPPNPPDRVDTVTATTSSVTPFSKSVFGTYLEAGVKTKLPYNFFFVLEAIRDFRSKDKAGIIGPAKGGGTLIGMRLGYRF
ncbi:MAG: hypothetical protein ACRECJ_11140 [Limisphaerales bacterium]